MSKLIAIIITIILIIIYIAILIDPTDNAPYYSYTDIKARMKTGDILLFSCKMYGTIIDKLWYATRTSFLGSDYGHAGIIIKSRGKLYVAEVCGPDQCGYQYAKHLNKSCQGGVRIIELDTLLNEYYKEYKGVYAVKFIDKAIPNKVMMANIKKYGHIVFQKRQTLYKLAIPDLFVSHSLAKYLASKYPTDQMICTEFLYRVLHDCGVLGEYPAKLFWPHIIVRDQFNSIAKVVYSLPYKFSVADYNNNSGHQ